MDYDILIVVRNPRYDNREKRMGEIFTLLANWEREITYFN